MTRLTLMLAVLAAAFSVGGLTDTARTAAPGAVLVVAAHPDDESLAYAGVIESAVAAHRTVVVAVVSNGANKSNTTDSLCGAAAGVASGYVNFALERDSESINALDVLGLTWEASLDSPVFFLGYPDTSLRTIESGGTFDDPTGLNTTFALDAKDTCNGDYHYLRTGSHASLTKAGLDGDIAALIDQVQPTDIYTHAISDGHYDHATVARVVLDAVLASKAEVTVHSTLVHPTGDWQCMPGSADWWPGPEEVSDTARATPDEPFGPVPIFATGNDTGYAPCPDGAKPIAHDWGPQGLPNETIPVPDDMQNANLTANPKWQALSKYGSQMNCSTGSHDIECGYVHGFVKHDEFAWTQVVSDAGAPVPVSWPRVSSPAGVEIGATFTAEWPAGDQFLGADGVSYQWQRCNVDERWRCDPITGATHASYTVTAADAGFALRVAAVGTKGTKSSPAVYSGSAPIPVAPANTVLPTVTGNVLVGSTLTAASGTWTGVPEPTLALQWQRAGSPTGTWDDIAGATSKTYVIASGDAGKYLRVQVTAANPVEAVAASAVVAAKPAVVTAPSVSGTVTAGATLSATAGVWSGAPVPSSVAYAWQSSAASTGPWTAITGATSSSYVVKPADVGQYLRVQVTVTNAVGATSAATIAAAPLVAKSAPTVSGKTTVGETLTASPGTWGGWPAPTFAYEWQSSASGTGDWSAVSGATSSSYTLRSDDAGRYLRVAVTATSGTTSLVAQSAATAKVVAAQSSSGGGSSSNSSGSGSSGGGGGGGGGGGYAADLALTGAVTPATATAGQTLVWTVDVANANLGPAVDAYVDLQLSANLTIVGSTATRGPGCVAATGNRLHCFLDWMSGDAPSATVTVTTTVAQEGEYTLDAKVGQLIPDAKTENDTLRLTAAAPAPPPPPPTPPAVVVKPTITIVKATVGSTGAAKVAVRVKGWAVNPKAVKNADGAAATGYWVIYVDGKRNAISRSPVAGTTKRLAVGRHVIRVELVHENGKPVSPRALSKPVVVTIRKRAHR